MKKFSLDYNQQDQWEIVGGQLQSPINIETNYLVPQDNLAPKIEMSFKEEACDLTNNGQNLQLLNQGSAFLNGRKFDLVQIHFHSESEHQINGKTYPLEGHFVYRAQDGQSAVVGVLYDFGKENPNFHKVLKEFDHELPEEIDLAGLLPENKSYYHYIGSLTTPPLTENIEWYVLQETLTVATEQVEAFVALHGKNNRQLQELNERKIIAFQE